ncbi:MAG: hypothetical protein ACOCSM_02765 [Bacillota bacterium]
MIIKKSIQIKDEQHVRGTTLIPVAQLLSPLTRDTGWLLAIRLHGDVFQKAVRIRSTIRSL